MTAAALILIAMTVLPAGKAPPVITQLNPTYSIAGGEPFVLTVYGANFVQGATILWNGLRRTTTFVSSTQLKTSVSTADLKVAPTPLKVANPNGEISATYVFNVTHAAPVLTSLNPRLAPAGSASLTMRILGRNFVRSGTHVYWKGAARAATFVSPYEITTVLSSADLATQGTVTVYVSTTVAKLDGSSSTQASGTMPFLIEPPTTVSISAAPVATSIHAVTATSQQGSGGQPVSQRPGVVVKDQYGSLMAGVPVAFLVTSGGGSVTPATVNTDALGFARVLNWTLGNSGVQTLIAKVANLPAVTFTATLAATIAIAIQPNPPPDLDLSYAQSSNPIVAGTRQIYTLKVFNRGGTNATGIRIHTDLPSDMTFVSAQPDHGFVCTHSGSVHTCTSGSVAPGDSARISIVMALPLQATAGHTIQIASRADPSNAIPETNELNNLASAVAQTAAAVAPVVDYRVSTQSEVQALIELAKSLGYQFTSTPLDKDIRCFLAQGKPVITASAVVTAFEKRCEFEFFKGKPLAPGWELRNPAWKQLMFTSAIEYINQPVPATGAYFRVQMRFTLNGSYELIAVTLRGPVGKTWRDAFQ